MCFGPVRDMCVVPALSPPATEGADEQQQADARRAGLHAVMAVGHGKGGGLAVVRRGLLPEVMTEVPIPGVNGVWALHCQKAATPAPAGGGGGRLWQEEAQAYLLMSLESETKIFACGEELEEITDDSCQFVADRPTIAAASLMGAQAIAQVHASGVRLVESAQHRLQDLSLADCLPEGSEASASLHLVDGAAASEGWLAIRLSNGQAALFQMDPQGKQLVRVEVASGSLASQPLQSPADAISALCFYEDASCWLSAAVGSASEGTPIFVAISRAGGTLEIFALPKWERIFCNSDVSQGYRTMVSEDNIEAMDLDGADPDGASEEPAEPQRAEALEYDDRVVELCMECFVGGGQEADPLPAPVLLALTGGGNLLAYKSFQPTNSDIRFKRLKIDWLAHHHGPPPVHGQCPRRMVRFSGLGEGLGMSGVFVAGMQPAWLVAAAGALQMHLYQCDGPVLAMTPFHNASCIKGMIVVTGLGEDSQMKICEVPAAPLGGSALRVDQQWITRKIQLRVTPHKVTHFADEKLFCLLISHMVPYRERLPEEVGGDAHAAAAYATSDAAAKVEGVEESHEVWVLREADFARLWSFELNPSEQGVATRIVTLKNINTPSPCQTTTFLAVGTATNLGEDYPCVGRLLLFRLSHDTSSGQLTTKELIYEREFRGPVTAINSLEQCLLCAVGSKLLLHYWDGERLTEAAFFDSPLLITCINVIKNFVLIGDVHKGVSFIRYVEKPREGQVTNPEREKYRQLLFLSKDYDQHDVTATEFIINDKQLGLLTADAGQTLELFQYDIQDPLSWRGKRLMPKASFHLGATVKAVLRLKMGCEVNRRAAVMGTTHGSVGAFCPAGEPEFRVLSRLLSLMQRRVEQPCGLNPRAFRNRFRHIPRNLGGGEHYGKPLSSVGALDGDLLWAYQWLSRTKQEKLAADAQSTRQEILQKLTAVADALSRLHLETGPTDLFL
mmetsp:Transcript_23855/g.66163  ORF Transcript_23855/g.66163 Transcript_23855/m.66163 type:complete len:958 (-) Transcript_23855:258-3131(-)